MFKGLIVAIASTAFAAPAFAAPVITFTAGSFALTGASGSIFQNFESAPGGGAQYVPAANETKVGDVRTFTNTVPGTAVDPDSNPANKYLSVEAGSYSVLFATPVQTFSFILGSLDSYNSLTLNFSSGAPITLLGRQIIGDTAVGPLNSGTSGRVNYSFAGMPGLTSAVFASSQAAFEIDDLASAVPEPASWAMLIGGLGLSGGMMRRRATKVSYAAA